jgi:acyl-CoA reductase-like NAD-dependent aldehyde dehydrogenase
MLESPAVAELLTTFTLLIDGAPVTTPTTLDVINPATGKVFARCPAAGRAELTDEDDALRRANDTRYGLSGSVWSADPERAAALAARLEVGTAWVNHHRATSATVPFGGAKESGIGRVLRDGAQGVSRAARRQRPQDAPLRRD